METLGTNVVTDYLYIFKVLGNYFLSQTCVGILVTIFNFAVSVMGLISLLNQVGLPLNGSSKIIMAFLFVKFSYLLLFNREFSIKQLPCGVTNGKKYLQQSNGFKENSQYAKKSLQLVLNCLKNEVLEKSLY